LCCLDLNLRQATAFSSIWQPMVRETYLLSFLLASLPLILLLREWRPPKLDVLTVAGTVLAFLATTGPYILAADAGRYIHCSLCMVSRSCASQGSNRLGARSLSPS
jgi:hypothetical protein